MTADIVRWAVDNPQQSCHHTSTIQEETFTYSFYTGNIRTWRKKLLKNFIFKCFFFFLTFSRLLLSNSPIGQGTYFIPTLPGSSSRPTLVPYTHVTLTHHDNRIFIGKQRENWTSCTMTRDSCLCCSKWFIVDTHDGRACTNNRCLHRQTTMNVHNRPSLHRF